MAGSIQNFSSVEIASEMPEEAVSAEELAKSDLWIFREGRREFSGADFLRQLQKRLASNDSLLDCLIQTGELEAALADLNSPGCENAAELTDALASRLCNTSSSSARGAAQIAAAIVVPATISISPHEGFTYYALHPLDFARLAENIADRAGDFAVIGIRSIGTTLSAVVMAALASKGKSASRITVRPSGHPYSRRTEFSTQQKAWVEERDRLAAYFVVVDEGPGRSGSTFLSVVEALERLGMPRNRIVVLGSRAFDPASLCAQGAAQRWGELEFLAAPSSIGNRFKEWTYFGGGDWRRHFYDREEIWPESWTQMERFKALSPDRHEFVKFEGMGRIGNEVKQRAYALAASGFSGQVSDIGDGFLSYAMLSGRLLRKEDVTSGILERMARYCAFRVSAFRNSRVMDGELEAMLTYNIQQEFGCELRLEPGVLASEEPVIVDGRMQPHEWIAMPQGAVLKTDAVSHGDNHFFPGPCGIAWDLAGAIVEWGLGKDEQEFLVGHFRKLSGCDVGRKLASYLLAYCVFRMGFCKMARSTVRGSKEEVRLNAAYRTYRAAASQLLDRANLSAVA